MILIAGLTCLSTWLSGQSCFFNSTYFGKNLQDDIRGFAIAPDRSVYVTGTTSSRQLPLASALVCDTLSGDYDAFVARFDSCGVLKWLTYVGTPGYDSGEKLKLDQAGNLVIAGYTDGSTLPHTNAGFQPASNGGYEGFVYKLSPAGTVIWGTYFGKNGSDLIYDLDIDTHGNILIGGTTSSSNLYVTGSSFQQTMNGALDAFVAKLSPAGSLLWSTYYGGSGSEDIHALVTDAHNNVIGVGGTFSNNLSTTPNCLQAFSNGGMEIYLIKLDEQGNRLWSSYLGGSALDDCYGLDADTAGNIYLSGPTASPNFTTTPGCYQSGYTGNTDLYVAKLTPGGALQWSTYIGGSDMEQVNRLVCSGNGDAYVLAATRSTDMPVIGNGNIPTLSGGFDLFLIKLTTSGIPVWTSYYGGSNDELGYEIALAGPNALLLSAYTTSPDVPVSPNAWQGTQLGQNDGLLAYIPFAGVPVGIGEAAAVSGFPTLYPNPAQDRLYVNGHSGPYKIFNSQGAIVLEGNEIDRFIAIDALPAGIYFLQAGFKNQIYHRTFVKHP